MDFVNILTIFPSNAAPCMDMSTACVKPGMEHTFEIQFDGIFTNDLTG